MTVMTVWTGCRMAWKGKDKLQLVSLVAIAGLLLTYGISLAQPSYDEAPMLAERVAAGELPPVAERLPDNPMVVEPVERIGSYGGEWRMGMFGAATSSLAKTIGYEHLMRWNLEWTGVVPNIAESVEVSEDAREYTFTLREGMRWSDGEPFTAADVLFWFESVALNEELSPAGPPSWLRAGGEPALVEQHGNFTITFSFAAPNGLFLQNLAAVWGSPPTSTPRHYLEQFHTDINPDGIDALVREAGFDNWVGLFQNRNDMWANRDKPTLHGWMLTTAVGEGNRVVAERNPYYWKVDAEGNQLPYIDRVVYDVVADVEVMVLKAMNGEIDMQDHDIGTWENRAVFTDNMTRGGYRFFETVPSKMNTVMIALNLTHQDPVKREIYGNKDFRIGLSHAIDREELIDLVFFGQGEPYQGAPRPETAFYHERLAKQYTEYDVALANDRLDRAGYSERDGEGFRLGPDGRRIIVTVLVDPSGKPYHGDVLEVVEGYWREVGIDMNIQSVSKELLYTRKEANEHDALVWDGDAGGLDAIINPAWYLPSGSESHYAPAWAHWYTGAVGIKEEPPALVQQQMDLYDQLKATADPDEQLELMEQILDIAADQFYGIGISLYPNRFGIVGNTFHNVPELMPWSWEYPNPAPTNPVQYFVED